MLLIVASKNPIKVQASLIAFETMFPTITWTVKGVSIPSGVSDQPRNEEETRLGARNRAEGAKKKFPEADYWVGIEGGIEEVDTDMHAFAWMAVIHKGHMGEGRTATFFLPPPVAELIRAGDELGVADDKIFGVSNSKQANGAIGLLSNNVIIRETLYVPAIVMALIPFKNPELYRIGE
ncbi:MAG: inosine/xanthosine triphosphatase [Bacteroidota bacterium]